MYSKETYYSFKILEDLSSMGDFWKNFNTYGNIDNKVLCELSDISILDIYYYLGLNLSIIREKVNYALPLALESVFEKNNFEILESVLLNNDDKILNIPSYRNYSFLNRIGIHTKKTKYKNKIFNLNACLYKIINLVKIKKSLSFNENISFLKKINWNEKNFNEMQILQKISDKYFSENEFVHIENLLQEAESLNVNDLFNINTIDELIEIDKKYINIIKAFSNIINFDFPLESFNLPSFEKDIILFKSQIEEILKKEPLFALNSGVSNLSLEFLLNKEPFEEKIKSENIIAYSLEGNLKYESVIFFVDYSILVKKHGEKDFVNFYNYDEMNSLIIDFYENYLKHLTKKTPAIKKALVQKYKKNKTTNCDLFYSTIRSINYYYKNYDTLKSTSFDLLNSISKNDDFHGVENIMYEIIKKHDIDKYSKVLLGNKYTHLHSEELDSIFNDFYNEKINPIDLKNIIGHKIASFKNSNELIDSLKKTLDLSTNFIFDIIHKKAKELNTKIISTDDNKLIIEIENFSQSQSLGSASWCISRDESNFLNYINGNKKQYFMYDFDKSSCENESLIGCTLTKNLKLEVAHFKNDKLVTDNKETDYIINKVKKHKNKY